MPGAAKTFDMESAAREMAPRGRVLASPVGTQRGAQLRATSVNLARENSYSNLQGQRREGSGPEPNSQYHLRSTAISGVSIAFLRIVPRGPSSDALTAPIARAQNRLCLRGDPLEQST